MKKLFATISIFLLLPIVAAVAGCNTLSEGDGWTEVQSITYTTDKGTTTLTSVCEWDIESESISKEEYNNAPEELKRDIDTFSYYIGKDKKSFKSAADSFIGNTYYCAPRFVGDYNKITINSYTLNYVKVKIISDKVVEIDFKGEVKQISTTSYEITYFEN